MFWGDHCAVPPVASHLLSRFWLEQIADDSHEVVQFRITTEDRMNKPGRIEAYPAGINKATTFPGFCQPHDNELFACLEKETFSATQEQLRALTYRSICCETCAKHQIVDCQWERADTQMQWALETEQQAPPSFAFHVMGEMNRCIRLFADKSHLETMWRSGRESISGYVVRFTKRPTVLCSTTINPLVSFTGRVLDSRWDWISISIIPSADGGWAVFSWDKSAPKNPSLFVKSFAKIPKHLQTIALLDCVFESTEYFAIAPEWWAKLSLEVQQHLFRRYGYGLKRGVEKAASGALLPSTKPWEDWEPIEAKYV